MRIEKVHSPSFSGIRKEIITITPSVAKAISDTRDKNSALDFLLPKKEKLLTKIIHFFSGKKPVGNIQIYNDGSFDGVRVFADGTKVIYGASKHLTKKYGEQLFFFSHVTGKGILHSSLPYKPFDKKGNIITPTLKEIKEYNRPENIISLIKEGKLKVINGSKS